MKNIRIDGIVKINVYIPIHSSSLYSQVMRRVCKFSIAVYECVVFHIEGEGWIVDETAIWFPVQQEIGTRERRNPEIVVRKDEECVDSDAWLRA